MRRVLRHRFCYAYWALALVGIGCGADASSSRCEAYLQRLQQCGLSADLTQSECEQSLGALQGTCANSTAALLTCIEQQSCGVLSDPNSVFCSVESTRVYIECPSASSGSGARLQTQHRAAPAALFSFPWCHGPDSNR